jgi:Ca2+-binding EF-hand superfamily protein
MYLVCDPDYTEIYLGIDRSHPVFWYKYTNKKRFYEHFDAIYETYNPKEYGLQFTNFCRGFVGSERMLDANMENLENFLMDNNFTEFLIWGSRWPDHPHRDMYINGTVNEKSNILYTKRALMQKQDAIRSASVRTRFSKSIITLEDHNGAYIVNIQYNGLTTDQIPEINEYFGRYYPNDLPVDVIVAMAELPFVTHVGLLRLEGITNNNFMMASLVANSKQMYCEMLEVVDEVLARKDNTEDKAKMFQYFKKNINANMKLYEIFESIKDDDDSNLEEELNSQLSSIKDESLKQHVINIVKDILH